MKSHPHDEFFKYLFSLMPVVREFIEVFLPPELVQHLDLDTLAADDTEYITPDLAAVYSDKVYRCQLQGQPAAEGEKPAEAAIALLMEHKSWAPRFPHFQLNEYRQRIWTTSVNAGQKPPTVLPVVLYHGTEAWTKPLRSTRGFRTGS